MCNGCLCIKPCMVVYGYTNWVYPLIVVNAICRKNTKTSSMCLLMSLNQYGNVCYESYHRYSHGGMIIWTSLIRSMFHYDVESLDDAFSSWFRMVCIVPFVMVQFLGRKKEMHPLRELWSSITICYIWKAHNTTVYYIWKAHCSLFIKLGSRQLKWCITFGYGGYF